MRWIFSFVITIHGLIHLMGPAKAFGYAELPQLTQPISRGMGLVWLLAALLCLAAVAAFFAWPWCPMPEASIAGGSRRPCGNTGRSVPTVSRRAAKRAGILRRGNTHTASSRCWT